MSNSERENFFKKLEKEKLSLKSKKDFEDNVYFKKIDPKGNLLRKYLKEIVKKDIKKNVKLDTAPPTNISRAMNSTGSETKSYSSNEAKSPIGVAKQNTGQTETDARLIFNDNNFASSHSFQPNQPTFDNKNTINYFSGMSATSTFVDDGREKGSSVVSSPVSKEPTSATPGPVFLPNQESPKNYAKL